MPTAQVDFLQALDPNRPLGQGELDRHYVERFAPVRARLAALLSQPGAKVCLTGQSGTGKSTELVRLQRDLSASMFAVMVRPGLTYDRTKIELQNLWAQGASDLVARAIDSGRFKPSPESVNRMAKFGHEKDHSFTPGRSHGENPGFVLQETSIAIREVEEGLQRPVALLFDDLERLPVEVARQVFCANSEALAAWPPRAVSVVPPLALYGAEWQEAERNLTGTEFLPAFPVLAGDRDGEAARQFFIRLAAARLGEEAGKLDPALLDRAVRAGGGVPRQFLRLLHEAYLQARLDGKEFPDSACLDRAIGRVRTEFHRKLAPPQLGLLRRIHADSPAELHEAERELLGMGCVLLYRSGEREWYDANPILALA